MNSARQHRHTSVEEILGQLQALSYERDSLKFDGRVKHSRRIARLLNDIGYKSLQLLDPVSRLVQEFQELAQVICTSYSETQSDTEAGPLSLNNKLNHVLARAKQLEYLVAEHQALEQTFNKSQERLRSQQPVPTNTASSSHSSAPGMQQGSAVWASTSAQQRGTAAFNFSADSTSALDGGSPWASHSTAAETAADAARLRARVMQLEAIVSRIQSRVLSRVSQSPSQSDSGTTPAQAAPVLPSPQAQVPAAAHQPPLTTISGRHATVNGPHLPLAVHHAGPGVTTQPAIPDSNPSDINPGVRRPEPLQQPTEPGSRPAAVKAPELVPLVGSTVPVSGNACAPLAGYQAVPQMSAQDEGQQRMDLQQQLWQQQLQQICSQKAAAAALAAAAVAAVASGSPLVEGAQSLKSSTSPKPVRGDHRSRSHRAVHQQQPTLGGAAAATPRDPASPLQACRDLHCPSPDQQGAPEPAPSGQPWSRPSSARKHPAQATLSDAFSKIEKETYGPSSLLDLPSSPAPYLSPQQYSTQLHGEQGMLQQYGGQPSGSEPVQLEIQMLRMRNLQLEHESSMVRSELSRALAEAEGQGLQPCQIKALPFKSSVAVKELLTYPGWPRTGLWHPPPRPPASGWVSTAAVAAAPSVAGASPAPPPKPSSGLLSASQRLLQPAHTQQQAQPALTVPMAHAAWAPSPGSHLAIADSIFPEDSSLQHCVSGRSSMRLFEPTPGPDDFLLPEASWTAGARYGGRSGSGMPPVSPPMLSRMTSLLGDPDLPSWDYGSSRGEASSPPQRASSRRASSQAGGDLPHSWAMEPASTHTGAAAAAASPLGRSAIAMLPATDRAAHVANGAERKEPRGRQDLLRSQAEEISSTAQSPPQQQQQQQASAWTGLQAKAPLQALPMMMELPPMPSFPPLAVDSPHIARRGDGSPGPAAPAKLSGARPINTDEAFPTGAAASSGSPYSSPQPWAQASGASSPSGLHRQDPSAAGAGAGAGAAFSSPRAQQQHRSGWGADSAWSARPAWGSEAQPLGARMPPNAARAWADVKAFVGAVDASTAAAVVAQPHLANAEASVPGQIHWAFQGDWDGPHELVRQKDGQPKVTAGKCTVKRTTSKSRTRKAPLEKLKDSVLGAMLAKRK